MNRLRRIILMTFIESFATICMERGSYFYTEHRLGFTDKMNLAMALVFGAVYTAGALWSHRLTVRLSEKRLLMATLVGQMLVHLALAAYPTRESIFVGMALIGLLNGLKWPVLESYMSAGRSPREAGRAIGMFNCAWAGAIPITLAVAGPLINYSSQALFLLPAALNVVSLVMCLPLSRAPLHMAADHPERPAPGLLLRLRSLMACSRWLMLGSYSAMWILAALMPRIFRDLGVNVESAPALSGALDLVRVATFVALWQWEGWQGRLGPLLISLVGLPAGFLLVLFGAHLPAVLAGEVLFGLCAGMVYYASLYYALVVKNASVDAGGGHEGLIGLGFAIGPAAALIGAGLAGSVGGQAYGILIGIAPVLATCSIAGLWLRAGRPAGNTSQVTGATLK